MKKFGKVLALGVLLLSLCSCFQDDKLRNDDVYTTIYPIEFLTSYLYGNEKNVVSIYPNGADVESYRLTDKQKQTYENGALFVYNGLTKEKELAREFLNKNDEMLLIDVAYGLGYEYAVEELWLSPNNYLMLAKNIKNNLVDYTTSKMMVDTITKNYQDLEEELSYMDADLRGIAREAQKSGKNTLVVSSEKLEFLKKYGFEVIVLNKEGVNIDSIKSNFKNGTYKDLYVSDAEEETSLINDLRDMGANVIKVEVMYTLTDEEEMLQENYLTIMKNFIEDIRNTALS